MEHINYFRSYFFTTTDLFRPFVVKHVFFCPSLLQTHTRTLSLSSLSHAPSLSPFSLSSLSFTCSFSLPPSLSPPSLSHAPSLSPLLSLLPLFHPLSLSLPNLSLPSPSPLSLSFSSLSLPLFIVLFFSKKTNIRSWDHLHTINPQNPNW